MSEIVLEPSVQELQNTIVTATKDCISRWVFRLIFVSKDSIAHILSVYESSRDGWLAPALSARRWKWENSLNIIIPTMKTSFKLNP